MNESKSLRAPVVASRSSLVYPGLNSVMRVGRPKSLAAIDAALKNGSQIVFVAQRDNAQDDPSTSDLYRFGTLCKIESVRGNVTTGYQVMLLGLKRVHLSNYVTNDSFLEADYELAPDRVDVDEATLKALRDSIKQVASEVLRLVPGDTQNLKSLLDAIEDVSLLTHLAADNLSLPFEQRQAILEMTSIKQRSLELLQLLQKQREMLQVQHDIRDRVSQKFGKQQRDALLREQMRAIQAELNETDNPEGNNDDYIKRIEDAGLPEEARKIAVAEAKRLEAMNEMSPEANVIRNYLDLMTSLPWKDSPIEDIDIVKARESLDADHFGLQKIKKRILQHLSVMKLKGNNKGSILLFVGPPGVGKTSLGQSIAKALGRKYVRVSLGGVRDDSEIRGHRRTYIGAMPGRIIQGIKRSGVNNPVFVLDEIDKLGMGYHGDPAAALLEVLDPEQNNSFGDHYLDVPFDLSKVFFIATANQIENIPGPLLDRMEVIEVTGYTSAEKIHIAKSHLIPKQLKEHGLTKEQLIINDETLLRIVSHYTREAGVRDLQRHITAVCRAATEKVVLADKEKLPIRISLDSLEDILGPELFEHEVAEKRVPPGVVTGLAWTPRGGDILFVESSLMPGTGRLTLTGQLGDVMKESAHIALSLVRSTLSHRLAQSDFDKNDVHIHVPAGAIPKDGPSAGVTLFSALASLFLGRPVSPKLAMTGEITLRGAITPVGGIKEKVMAAHRAGIERIIMCKRNEKDLRDVPEEVRTQLKFDFVESIDELLQSVFGEAEQAPIFEASDTGAHDIDFRAT